MVYVFQNEFRILDPTVQPRQQSVAAVHRCTRQEVL